ncbi:nucleic acid/nucleotide deaminase domain-containing protein [Streptomyces goshikiensis]|uniref:nucleic acid/nucleotide deaminase domain-containing protein n=1 Tax=Streptomyces goshikiensis TaxID=1942 RepID=UPI00367A7D84
MAYAGSKAAGFNSGRNVAVARVPGWNNPKTGDLVVGFSKGNGYHAEDHIFDQLKAKGFKPSQIVELYTERSPCDICKPKLAAELAPGTPISWSVLTVRVQVTCSTPLSRLSNDPLSSGPQKSSRPECGGNSLSRPSTALFSKRKTYDRIRVRSRIRRGYHHPEQPGRSGY